MFFKHTSRLSGGAPVAGGFLMPASLAEERENLNYFGDQYRDHMKCSKRYLPFLL